jgi:enamine deaminase RidA (YjgF/YER057c/UK114 family)
MTQLAIKRVNPAGHKSDSVIANGFVFVAGIVPSDRNATLSNQAEQVFSRIDRILLESGSNRSRIVSATVWLADIDDYAPFNQIWNRWIADGEQPARACIGAAIAAKGAKVEVSVTALVNE